MERQTAKQCCGLVFTSASEFKEHLEEHKLEQTCGCG
jgi:hypothetical protein